MFLFDDTIVKVPSDLLAARLITLLEEIHLDGRSLLSVIEEESRGRSSASVRSTSSCSHQSPSPTRPSPVIISASSIPRNAKGAGLESDGLLTPATLGQSQAASQRATSSDAGVVSSAVQAYRPPPLHSVLIPPSCDATQQWMRSYHGTLFPVPRPNSSPPFFYCVVKETSVGIFDTWYVNLIELNLNGVMLSIFKGLRVGPMLCGSEEQCTKRLSTLMKLFACSEQLWTEVLWKNYPSSSLKLIMLYF
jgi:hypothetical protein